MIASLLLAATMLQAAPAMTNDPIFHETPAARDARMAWWREARFGLFIHWGLYAIPAGKWGDATGHGEWIRDTAKIPYDVYDGLQGQFNPTQFDAEAWARMAKQAGMKYVVITTKHHDGFALFDSKWTEWDVMGSPFKRDIMDELANACRKYGLKMGWYHSIMDWRHPDYLPRRGWEVEKRPVTGADFDRYVTFLRNQVTELLTRYGDIAVMWFDGEWESTWSDDYGKPLYELCRTLQPDVIVNNRVSNSRGGMEDASAGGVGDYTTPEQYIPPTGMPGVDWETCMTMNRHWGWNAADDVWKSSTDLIRNLVDIASKGGNYLLNVGPMADGAFPPKAVERLADIGKWMDRFGESIYGTTASVFDALPWGRCTRNGSRLYLHVFDWPADGRLTVPGVGNEALRAAILGGPEVQVRRHASDLVLNVPGAAPDAACTVIALDLDGAPIVYRAPKIIAPAPEFVSVIEVRLESGSEGLDVRYTLDGADPGPASTKASGVVSIDKTATLRAAAFHDGKRVSAVVEGLFRKVTPWPAVSARGLEAGLTVETFSGDFDKVPDFAKLEAKSTGTAASPSIASAKEIGENVARRYTGYVNVPEDGLYVFALESDDGSLLRIDGRLVIDHDGLHSPSVKMGYAPLAKGPHELEIGWFNKTGDARLGLSWALAGQRPKTDAASFLRARPR